MPMLPPAQRLTLALIALGAAMLGGCASVPSKTVEPPRPTVTPGPSPKSEVWKQVASDFDKDRLGRLGLAWSDALGEASRTNAADIRREGALFRPRGSLDLPTPSPGSYNCRLFEVGRGEKKKGAAFTAYKPFFCYVEVDDGQLTFVKQTGSQRPSGRLWEDDDPKRMIFLGSMAIGATDKTLAYGDNPQRDMVGTFERVGPFRWRLVVPYPQDGSTKLDIYELTPTADQPK